MYSRFHWQGRLHPNCKYIDVYRYIFPLQSATINKTVQWFRTYSSVLPKAFFIGTTHFPVFPHLSPFSIHVENMILMHVFYSPRHRTPPPTRFLFFPIREVLGQRVQPGKSRAIPWKCQLKSTFQELIPQEVSYIYIIINKYIHLGWLHVCLANQKLHPASEGGRRENRGTRSKGFSKFTHLRKGGPLN